MTRTYTITFLFTVKCTFLYYIGKCKRPELMPVCTFNTDSVPRVEGYNGIVPVEGSTIRFDCPPGFELIGPNLATCTGNREWEPDLRGIMCNNSTKG